MVQQKWENGTHLFSQPPWLILSLTENLCFPFDTGESLCVLYLSLLLLFLSFTRDLSPAGFLPLLSKRNVQSIP